MNRRGFFGWLASMVCLGMANVSTSVKTIEEPKQILYNGIKVVIPADYRMEMCECCCNVVTGDTKLSYHVVRIRS